MTRRLTPREVIKVRPAASALHAAAARVVIDCARCGRHGDYSRDRAIEQYGDISLRDFMFRVVSAECALMLHPNGHTPCKSGVGSTRQLGDCIPLVPRTFG